MSNNLLVRILGWPATIVHGDPAVPQRWWWLKKHLQPGPLRTFDAGCGSGAFTLYAARIGNESVGMSFDTANWEKARQRARILKLPNARFEVGDLRQLDELAVKLGVFDQIVCFETIEHILDDRKLVRDLANLLAPGGRLLLTTPYKYYRPIWGDRLSTEEDGGHVRWGYTHEELRELLGDCGLTVRSEDFLCGVVTQKLMSLARILGRVNPKLSWLVVSSLRPLQVFDAPLTWLFRYPHLTVAVVGERLAGDQPAS
jgi:SAM-dependent methyltransferase